MEWMEWNGMESRDDAKLNGRGSELSPRNFRENYR